MLSLSKHALNQIRSSPDLIRGCRSIEWIQPRLPYGGWTDRAGFAPEPVQACVSVGRLVHDDDSIKMLAGSAMIVGDEERLMLSGVIEIPARRVVRIVRLEECPR